MPCDSAAAGLIALGAMLKRLETDGANDRAAHFERIRYLSAQPNNGVDLFDQRNRGRKRGPYFLDGQLNVDQMWACLRAEPETRVTISQSSARFWQFFGEPPVEILDGGSLSHGTIYSELPGASGTIRTENLNHSDSDICLAGRPSGDAGTRRAMGELRFWTQSGPIASLADLLTIHEWQGETVSRVVFFNTRTRQFDRVSRPPRLVLTDGELSFAAALSRFPESDVVGVISRSSDREKLEIVGARMADMNQWFEGDDDLVRQLPVAPRGISLSVLRER
jgi:hypothetical protein